VLVIDDERAIRLLCRVNLAASGMEVLEAADGREGIELARRERPDLVLLDVMMPEVDGWEMLRRVQERHGAGSIPVVMFSGHVEGDAAREATERGARAFVGKPFDLRTLIEQTKQILPA
jgi:CheY-like chemotaxis protein